MTLMTMTFMYTFDINDNTISNRYECEIESPRIVKFQVVERAFLNSPHLLEVLSDLGAYGSQVSILGDHDTINYLRAINFVLWKLIKHMRRLQREHRRQNLVASCDSRLFNIFS
jgi:hypothetical protein